MPESGVVRKARQRRVAGEEGGEGGGGGGKKKKKKRATICELNGWQWEASEKFDIERILTLAPALAHCTPSLMWPPTYSRLTGQEAGRGVVLFDPLEGVPA